MKRYLLPLTFLFALFLTGNAALAASSVDSKIAALEETIRLLERRVTSVEAQLRERTPSSRVAPDKANWRKLKKGLSEGDVEQLLGSPSRVDAFGPYTAWHYGSGSVEFDADTQKVESWHEPR
jgi:outer membrane protein assembly factor BamE (lipoprotein component of BamABCDE complex)